MTDTTHTAQTTQTTNPLTEWASSRNDLSGFADREWLARIHSTDRRINNTIILPSGELSKVALLDFIGASDYVITEYGNVFHRARAGRNRLGYIDRGWCPEVYRDPAFEFPWVLLDTDNGQIWYPINQLLGWAFCPQPDVCDRYFLPKQPLIFRRPDEFVWVSHPQVADGVRSQYLEFMDAIYAIDPEFPF